MNAMPLFDFIKDPNTAEAVAVLVAQEESTAEETPTTQHAELETLREIARTVDAREAEPRRYPMDPQAERFLASCLEQARRSCEHPYRQDNEIEDGLPPTLRAVGVSLLKGDWQTVLNCRESALAAVAELRRRGFVVPRHEYVRVAGQWELRIRFCI